MTQRRDLASWILLVMGIGAAVNGIWMLLDAVRWFGLLASATGDLNVHLVRDVGAAYATVGVALVWAARRPAARLPLTATAAVFLGLHAAGHVFETATGALPPDHWVEDVPGVYLPALVTLILAVRFARGPAPA